MAGGDLSAYPAAQKRKAARIGASAMDHRGGDAPGRRTEARVADGDIRKPGKRSPAPQGGNGRPPRA